MRALVLAGFVTFSLASIAPLERCGTTTEASGAKLADAPAGPLGEAIAVARKLVAHLPAEPGIQAWSASSPGEQGRPRLAVGDVLPEGTALFPVPRNESYRYAIVEGRRAIVDAASRQIVYVIQ